MAKYKLRNNITYALDGTTVQSTSEDILDTELKTSIPKDPANADYVEYLKWLNGEDPYTEKGTPEAAD